MAATPYAEGAVGLHPLTSSSARIVSTSRRDGLTRSTAQSRRHQGDQRRHGRHFHSNSAIETATSWLGEFGAALALGKASRIAVLLANECHWRDILALPWNVRTASGAEGIAKLMTSALVPTPTSGTETFSAATGEPTYDPDNHPQQRNSDPAVGFWYTEDPPGPCTDA